MHDDIPIFIPSFNNPTYVGNMINQILAKNLTNIIVVDNCSTSRKMRDFLDSLASPIKLERLSTNFGPRYIFRSKDRLASLPTIFCVTDPDLQMNPQLPVDFIDELVLCTERFGVGKAGFSLDISNPAEFRDEAFLIGGSSYRPWEWERQFWKTRLGATTDGSPVYKASVDTTFAVYNKRFYYDRLHFRGVRVAGNYTCRHLPWYRDSIVPPDEDRHYVETSSHSFFQTDRSDGIGAIRRRHRPILDTQRAIKARIGLFCKVARARLFP